MTVTITAIENSPDHGQGLARDMPIRWALEEVGQPYEARLVSFAAMKKPPHIALHPFGQIPTYEDGELALFESGAIVLHIAQQNAGLMPDDANGRARALSWIFASLHTMDPSIFELDMAPFMDGDKPWYQDRLPLLKERVRARLAPLSHRLAESEWLDGAFSAGDLMMVSVLRRLHGSGLLEEYPNLWEYVARGEHRPAFARAFEAQCAAFARTHVPLSH